MQGAQGTPEGLRGGGSSLEGARETPLEITYV